MVFAGGGAGAVLRYLINRGFTAFQVRFPYATLTANVLSCLILGSVLGYLAFRSGHSQLIRLLFITGFCGGLSTYSTFTVETMELFREGLFGPLLLNIAGNLFLCIGAVSAGMYLGRLAAGA